MLESSEASVNSALQRATATMESDRISAITRFVDNSNMARFGLPRMLAD